MNPNVRNEVLQLLADGKITAAEAIELLDKQPTAAPVAEALDSLKAQEALPAAPEKEVSVAEWKNEAAPVVESFDGIKITEDDVASPAKNGDRPRWLKIRVRDLNTGRNKVSVSLPLGLVSLGLGIAKRFGADFDEAENVEEIWQLVKNGERGVIVDVQDEDDNEHVQIYLD